MTNKPFLTINQQLDLAESRGVQINELTSGELLRREGYYTVVNGYRGPFLMASADGLSGDSVADQFVSGTDLEQLGALLRFDRQLRGVLMVGLAECETLLREATVRAFCAAHSSPHEYLNIACYSDGLDRAWLTGRRRSQYLEGRDRLVRSTLRRIGAPRSPSEALRKDFAPLKHYRNAHDAVPLWIAALALTFGEVCALYSSQQDAVRDVIRADLRQLYELSWQVRSEAFNERSVDNYYSFFRKLRNVCAHDERCYCVRLRARGELGVADIAGRMRYFMTKASYVEMEAETNRLLARLSEQIPPEVHSAVVRQVRPASL